MKSLTIVKFAFLSILVGACGLAAASGALAQDQIKFCCSNQVYQAIAQDLVEAFAKETGVDMDVKTASSGSCLYSLGSGFSDIAGTARKLYQRHEVYGYQEFAFCKDPLSVVARKECGVDSLTEEQLQDLFAGEIHNWSEVGGADLPVRIVVPDKDTAAHKNFRRQVMKHKDIAHDFVAQDSTSVIEILKNFPCGAVSFVSRGAAKRHGELKNIRIDGLAPSDEKYPYYQIFFLVVNKEPEGNLKKFIDFVYSPKSAKIIKDNGMTPLSK